jgi:hypothetical protein
MQIVASSSERAVISPASRQEQSTILGSLPLKEYLHSRLTLLVQKAAGRPAELSLSRDTLSELAGNIYWHDDSNREAARVVYDGVQGYLDSTKPQPTGSSQLH